MAMMYNDNMSIGSNQSSASGSSFPLRSIDGGGGNDGFGSETGSVRDSMTDSVRSTDGDNRNNAAPAALAEKESKRVFRSKLGFMIVLFLTAASFAATAYIVTLRGQNKDFRVRFKDFANQVIDVTRINIRNIFKDYETLSTLITNYAQSTGADFPFVTYPEFESQSASILGPTAASLVLTAYFVEEEQRQLYEQYALANQQWVQHGLDFSGWNTTAQSIVPFLYEIADGDFTQLRPAGPRDSEHPFYAPVYQYAPVPPVPYLTNYDAFDYPPFAGTLENIRSDEVTLFSSVTNLNDTTSEATESDTASTTGTDSNITVVFPTSNIATPLYNNNKKEKIVGMVAGTQPWHSLFSNLVPEDVEGLIVVVKNSCNQVFTFQIDGPEVFYLGVGDFHDPDYNGQGISFDLAKELKTLDSCAYTFIVYPSEDFERSYRNQSPIYYTLAVIFIFGLTTASFIIYDLVVEKRQEKVLESANKSNAIVNSLFPANVRDRLLVGDDNKKSERRKNAKGNKKGGQNASNNNSRIPSRFSESVAKSLGGYGFTGGTSSDMPKDKSNHHCSKPIADLFPSATVMFADIVGFTAWSSVREPSQVFMMLESVYNSFDRIAKKLGVFKVETIGDSYVAACGLPEVRDDHAVVMVKFAHDCLLKMRHVAKKLEVELGPDTSELTMRVGIHSGPVTAGVLRGEKSRFQLFGDTVNTASRMESTAEPSRIQVSQETADLLVIAGKAHLIKPRETTVHAKGKGELHTYWLNFDVAAGQMNLGIEQPSSSGEARSEAADFDYDLLGSVSKHQDPSSTVDSAATRPASESNGSISSVVLDERVSRLVDWNVDILQGLLKKIIAMRDNRVSLLRNNNSNSTSIDKLVLQPRVGETVLDEVQEIIKLPSKSSKYKVDPDSVVLDAVVIRELYDYVKKIAAMYRPNAFHSFDHASHVVQSVTKLLSRVVTPSSIASSGDHMHMKKQGAAILHQYTYGITSDPITQFACAFSALIHDVDHSGLPNAQLVKEKSELAIMYKNKSVAEQNSVDIAWELLMEPRYKNLRSCIYTNQTELIRFRQLVVNSVMATDVVDKELGALRKKRWNAAFAESGDNESVNFSVHSSDTGSSRSMQEATNRKATIVIEHLIQASDVAHTMQHWHVYVKWNERFFRECYKAYLDGKAEKDPSIGWYEGELGFFDFYIIPLAKKLKECGVFGVSSDEYLNYAQANRQEWEKKGKDVVERYLEHYKQEDDDDTKSGEQTS